MAWQILNCAWRNLEEASQGELAELLVFKKILSSDELTKLEGSLALQWGLSLPSSHPFNANAPEDIDFMIATGEVVNIAINADRNPTSWTATGLASGLSINNSGIISGSTSYIGDFNATVTAINADGNDSKLLRFTVSKGKRIITWDQNFSGITYGDNPLSFNASATGSGDLNYTSSDSSILEINGTNAIVKAGGTATITATAAENSTAFAATPVSKTIACGQSCFSYQRATYRTLQAFPSQTLIGPQPVGNIMMPLMLLGVTHHM